MIVDAKTLDILPVADKVMQEQAGSITNEVNRGTITWSNELVLHVIELKTTAPASDMTGLPEAFQKEIHDINRILESAGGRLMPGAMHPWMNPDLETHLWPHEFNAIYESYNRIFDCRGHGWTNVQSSHLNLSFLGDKEFEKLHAAIRLILPLIPALSASSPLADGIIQPWLDYRMEVYRTNSIKIPSVTGYVIPEQVFTEQEYRNRIFDPMYRDITPFDPDGILQDEWLNSRGAIARFDRGSIEIRVIDVQECPKADIAILELLIRSIKELTNQTWCSLKDQKKWGEDILFGILNDVVKSGEQAVIGHKGFLDLFGYPGKNALAGELWQHIYEETGQQGSLSAEHREALDIILNQGPLARRILKSLPPRFTKEDLQSTYTRLCDCLENGELFTN